ncbi:hypothetical protein EVAR_67375_1, partial [Eumeta japonica]
MWLFKTANASTTLHNTAHRPLPRRHINTQANFTGQHFHRSLEKVLILFAAVVCVKARFYTLVRESEEQSAPAHIYAQPQLEYDHHHISEDEHVDYY